MLHRIVDGYCQPPMNEQQTVMVEWEIPKGYSYTKLNKGEGKYNYKEVDELTREEYQELRVNVDKVRYIRHGKKERHQRTESGRLVDREIHRKELQQRLHREKLEDSIYFKKIGISLY